MHDRVIEPDRMDEDPAPVSMKQANGVRAAIIVIFLFALQVADGVDQVALSFAAPFMRQELGLGFEALGAAFTAGYIGTALGAIIFGIAADRVGRKPALCCSGIAFAGGSLATIWVTSGFELILIRFLTGLALGGLLPVVSAIVLQTVARGMRATAVTLVMVGTALGAAICGPITSVIEPYFGWQGIFLVGSIVPVILVGFAIVFVPNAGRPAAKSRQASSGLGRQVGEVIQNVSALFEGERRGVTLTLWLALTAAAVPMFFTLSWLPSLAHDAGIPQGTLSIASSIFSLAGLVVAVSVARIIDRTGLAALVVTTGLGSVAFLALGQSFGSNVAFMVACGLAGGLSVSAVNLIGAIAGMLYPDALRARGVGWAVAVMRLGAALTPGLGGVLIARGLPASALFLIMAAFPMISAYALFRLRGRIIAE